LFAFLPGPIKGILAAAIFCLNTLFWCLLLYIFVIVKVLIPVKAVRQLCTRAMIAIGQNWISFNNFEMALLHYIRWDITGLEQVRMDRSYLIFANHQSWVDIVVLQKSFKGLRYRY
jgi:1-acyl-sn-glycerol-3-phosphate acyltransferase